MNVRSHGYICMWCNYSQEYYNICQKVHTNICRHWFNFSKIHLIKGCACVCVCVCNSNRIYEKNTENFSQTNNGY